MRTFARAKWFVPLGLVALVVIVLVGIRGCLLGARLDIPCLNNGDVEGLERRKVAILYARWRSIFVFKDGAARSLGPNPAGYDSLDHWIGYSVTGRSVLFRRFVEDHIRLLDVNIRQGKLGTREAWRLRLQDGDPCIGAVFGDQLYEIRGSYRTVQLWAFSVDGKSKLVDSWQLPGDVPVAKKWVSLPGVGGTNVVFGTPSGCVISASTGHAGKVSVLWKGNPNWHDPGYPLDAFVSAIALSPDGKWALCACPENKNWPVLTAFNCATGIRRDYTIWKPSSSGTYLEQAFEGPTIVMRVTPIPGNDYVACEITALESGQSDIFLVDLVTGTSRRFPIKVERQQWAVIPSVQ